MALSSAFRERLEQMENTRNERLSLLQAEKEAQSDKSQILSSKLGIIRSIELRCLLIDQKIASQNFKISSLKSEIEKLDAKVLKSEVEELEEMEREKESYYRLKGFEMNEFLENVDDFVKEFRLRVEELRNKKNKLSSTFKELQGNNGYSSYSEIAAAEMRKSELVAMKENMNKNLDSNYEVRAQLQKQLQNLSKEAAPATVSQSPTPITTAAKVPFTPAVSYVTLASFSWDQDNEKVKIYLSLEGVDQEKIETEFKQMSFDVKFHDVQGKNYRLTIPKLNKAIVPENCKVVIKPSRVIITLVKASKGNWLDLHFKEDKLKPNLDKERDPMAGIMDLMKVSSLCPSGAYSCNMYEEGDEEMKRTIAKAWTDARSGKTADPLKGYR
ncbi:hypothetical protein JRO89_XS06G0017000 [Xanthoceras sorbifolium]|uniref:Calcyclin-binding protein n=1 Tax=Xanthoceras sorbifolium TaxID=99658 RepID=A0ABQ8HW31_9ROSI|nr:hypothetical protein JRO89_XS06G0017000 [Xanthoceras sorbifolium]